MRWIALLLPLALVSGCLESADPMAAEAKSVPDPGSQVELATISYKGQTGPGVCFGVAGQLGRCVQQAPGVNTPKALDLPAGAKTLAGKAVATSGVWAFVHVRLVQNGVVIAYQDAATPAPFSFELPADLQGLQLTVAIADGPYLAGAYVWPEPAADFEVAATAVSA